MRKPFKIFRRFTIATLFIPLAFGTFYSPSLGNDKSPKPSATEEDLFLYRAIGATYICVAREVDIEFTKATAIAAITYVNLLEGRHGGKIQSIDNKNLTRKELIYGANNQLIPAAVEYCPDKVPEKTKKEVKKFLKKMKAESNKKKR